MPASDPRPRPSPAGAAPLLPLPATPVLWRGSGLQVGLAPGQVWLLQGPRDELRQAAGVITGGEAPDRRSPVTRRLHAAGLLTTTAPHRPRPAPVVEVRGGDRLGAHLAITAADLGARVTLLDRSPILPTDRFTGGFTADDIGLPRGATLTDRLSDRGLRAVGPETRRDLVVLGDGSDLDPAATDPLLRSGTAHLVARRRGGVVQLGPLVVPGRTPCLRCLDLHRTDADPEWPALALQLLRSAEEAAGHAQTLVATGLAHQVMSAFLTGRSAAGADDVVPSALYRVTEEELPWAEPVHAHPGCGCRWTGAAAAPDRAEPATITQ